jgi:hypothetical protein
MHELYRNLSFPNFLIAKHSVYMVYGIHGLGMLKR